MQGVGRQTMKCVSMTPPGHVLARSLQKLPRRGPNSELHVQPTSFCSHRACWPQSSCQAPPCLAFARPPHSDRPGGLCVTHLAAAHVSDLSSLHVPFRVGTARDSSPRATPPFLPSSSPRARHSSPRATPPLAWQAPTQLPASPLLFIIYIIYIIYIHI